MLERGVAASRAAADAQRRKELDGVRNRARLQIVCRSGCVILNDHDASQVEQFLLDAKEQARVKVPKLLQQKLEALAQKPSGQDADSDEASAQRR